jgi:hypothetical protein
MFFLNKGETSKGLHAILINSERKIYRTVPNFYREDPKRIREKAIRSSTPAGVVNTNSICGHPRRCQGLHLEPRGREVPLRARRGASTWRLRKPRPSPASRETTSWSSESVARTWATESAHLAHAASHLQGNPRPGHRDSAASSPFHLHGTLKKTAHHHLHLDSNCHKRPYFWSSL